MHYSFAHIMAKEFIPGFKGKIINGKNITLALWEVVEGASVAEHQHPQEQHLLCLDGQFELSMGSKKYILKKDDVFVIPPNEAHSGKAITKCSLMDVFSPTRTQFGKTE